MATPDPTLIKLFEESGPLHRIKGDEDLSMFLGEIDAASNTPILEDALNEVYHHTDKPQIVKRILAAVLLSGFRTGKRFERHLAEGDKLVEESLKRKGLI